MRPKRRQLQRVLLPIAVLVAFLSASTTPSTARADEAGPRRSTATAFDFGLGAALVQVRDDTLRPLRWTGGAASLSLGLDVDAPSALHHADLIQGFGMIWNRYGHRGFVTNQGLHYAYLHRVGAGRKPGLLVGGAYRWETLAAYFADWDDSFLYWLTSHTFAPAVGFEVLPSARSRLLVSVEIPLVGVMSRSPEERTDKVDPLTTPLKWTTRAHADARWAGPWDLYAPSVSAAYSRAFGRHWGMNLVFDLFYRHTPEPKTFLALGERLTYQMRYVF